MFQRIELKIVGWFCFFVLLLLLCLFVVVVVLLLLFFLGGEGGGFDPADFKLSVAVTVHARDKVMHSECHS